MGKEKQYIYYKFFLNVLQRASIYIAVCVGKVFVLLVVGFVEGLPCMKKTISIYIGEEGWDQSKVISPFMRGNLMPPPSG